MTTLLEWIKPQLEDKFPKNSGNSYPKKIEYIHTEIRTTLDMVGACVAAQDGNILNDHSIEHVNMVIERASQMLSYPKETFPQISAYEVYLLLIAIHFHDAGNIFGRDNHANEAKKVIENFSGFLGNNQLEMKAVREIVKSHASDNGNKDTISTLKEKETIYEQTVRYQFLAAILRFADELADNYSRANRVGIENRTIPQKSLVYHKYSQSLHTVKIEPQNHSIQLQFVFTKHDAIQQFGRDDKEVYLQDEIMERTIKMFNEMKYCMKFTDGIVFFDRINVIIEIYDDTFNHLVLQMSYSLCDKGYPSYAKENFVHFSEEIKTGEQLRVFLESSNEQPC